MSLCNSIRQLEAARTVAFFLLFAAGIPARAQSLAVVPVNVLLAPGQNAATLTVTNQGDRETAIQIRPFAWNQPDGNDDLAPTNALVISPPLTTIAPGATQVVRLILRQPPQDRELTYRILVDQIPPPAEPGIVHVVLRLSIPIFAQPPVRALPHLQFHLEYEAGQIYLVGANDGLRHEVIRDIVLSTSDGARLKADSGLSPYILAGVKRRWHIAATGSLPSSTETLRLTAHCDSGAIDEQVSIVAKP
jgi:fimbrial chaperone protein